MAEEQKYKIIQKLDAGGMAEVFVADSESIKGFKKRVAIKRILPHLTKNRKFVQMFLDEAKLSLQLEHANIVNVFDIGKAENTYFIVMEFVDGANLKKVIESHRRAGRRVPIEQAVFLMREVCEGLAYAHDFNDLHTGEHLGIVHRDVSPPNILISKRGEIKMVDFGLAKATSQLESTDPGVVKGKFSYLSPEGASGLDVDRRADIFSAGILLFELLTGQRLFYGESDYHTVELVRKAEVPRITQINPDVPQEMEDILGRALAKDPGNRYQTAFELSEDLTKMLFTRGVAVGRGDIARLVDFTVEEQNTAAPPAAKRATTIIDALIQEEILKFTSLDDMDSPVEEGAKPLSPDEISVLDPGDFIDPRGWAADMDDGLGDLTPHPERIHDRSPSREGDKKNLGISSPRLTALDEEAARSPLPVRDEAQVPGNTDASARSAETSSKGSSSALVWVLMVAALLAATAATLVVLDVIAI